jgi:3-oxoacyl-[acyl-carrier-protein] synthase III
VVGPAREALQRAAIDPGEIEMLINCNITRYQDGLDMRLGPGSR